MHLWVWQTSNSSCYTWHYPALAQHREGEIHCEVHAVCERQCCAWRESKMAYHRRENSTCTRISCKCAISSRTVHAVREPFHPGTTYLHPCQVVTGSTFPRWLYKAEVLNVLVSHILLPLPIIFYSGKMISSRHLTTSCIIARYREWSCTCVLIIIMRMRCKWYSWAEMANLGEITLPCLVHLIMHSFANI